MSKRIDELIGVIKSWVGWFDWNEAQREVLKDVLFNLEKAKRVEELEEELNRHNIVMESFRVDELAQQNKRYREALSFVELELYEVLHENKELNVKMFHIENAKRMITKVLNEEE